MVEVQHQDSDTDDGFTLKKLRNELRISKKAEQLAKEKLAAIKKQLEKTQADLAKSKTESEAMVDGLREDATNKASKSPTDVIVDQYSRQLEQSAKEVSALQEKLQRKKTKIQELKKAAQEAESKNGIMQAKLTEMAKFAKTLIKSMQTQQLQLKTHIQQEHSAFSSELETLSTQLLQQMSGKLANINPVESQELKKVSEENVALRDKLAGLEIINASQEQEVQMFKGRCHDYKCELLELRREQTEAEAEFRQSEASFLSQINQANSQASKEASNSAQVQLLLDEANLQLTLMRTENESLRFRISKLKAKDSLQTSETIEMTVIQPKTGLLSLERNGSRCSSESVRSHKMLRLPEENAHSDETQGDVLEKQLSPRKEFPADMAPRPMNPAPRPQGQTVRQVRPMMPVQPKKMQVRDESPKEARETPRVQQVALPTKAPVRPKIVAKPMHTDPFSQTTEATTEEALVTQPKITQPEKESNEPAQPEVEKPKQSMNVGEPSPVHVHQIVEAAQPVKAIEETKSAPSARTPETSPLKKQQSSKAEPVPNAANAENQDEGRFSSMINSLLSYLGRKKKTQAFLGQSASKMTWHEGKGRYVFEGESSSEEEVLPEPPKTRKAEPKEEPKEEVKELTGTAALTQVAFGGALSNRGRGRGARGGRPAMPDRIMPMMSAEPVEPKQLSKPEQKPDEIIKELDQTVNETFITTNDQTLNQTMINKTLNMTMYTANDESRIEDAELCKRDRMLGELHLQIAEVENVWKQKCATLQEKVKQMSKQVGLIQTELSDEKQHTQQTIEGMESFIAELKIEGEIFQSEISALKQKLVQQTDTLAVTEFRLLQVADEHAIQTNELEELRIQLFRAEQDAARREMDMEMLKLTHQMDALQTQTLSSSTELLELETQRETFRWEQSFNEIEILRLQNENEMIFKRNAQLMAEIELITIQRDSEPKVQSMEHAKANERERDSLKEMVSKLSIEKDRLQEQIKDRERERDTQMKKLDAEKKEMQRNFQKTLKDKEAQWQEKLDRQEADKQDQLRRLEDSLKQQAAELQKQEVKRSFENKRNEKQIKQQLEGLEGILNKKEEDLSSLQGYNQEVTAELAQMSQMREKLHDHIAYLQNEIRKRDELLEEGSELVDVDLDSDSFMEDDSMRHCLSNFNLDDDTNLISPHVSEHKPTEPRPKRRTLGQVLKGQLEESRNQLKTQVEQKLRTEVRCRAAEGKVDKLNEGLHDIMQILRQNIMRFESDQPTNNSDDKSSEQMSESGEQIVHQIIGKLFKIIRSFEAQKLELQHQLNQLVLKLDDTENIKFDLELAIDEKQMLESELDQLRLENQSLRKKVDSDVSAKHLAQSQVLSQKLADLQRQHQAELQQAKANYEQLGHEMQTEIYELRDKLAEQTAAEEQHTIKMQEIQVELHTATTQMESMQAQLGENQRIKQAAEDALETKAQEMHQWQEEKTVDEQQHKKAHNEVLRELSQLKQRALTEKKDHADEVQRFKEDLATKDSVIERIQGELDLIVQQFIAKKESYKQQVSRFKSELMEAAGQLQQMEDDCGQKQAQIDELTAQVKERQAKDRDAELDQARAKEEAKDWRLKFESLRNESDQTIADLSDQLDQRKRDQQQQKSLLEMARQQIDELESKVKGLVDQLNAVSVEHQGLDQAQVDELVQQTKTEALEAIEKLKQKHQDKEGKLRQELEQFMSDQQSTQDQLNECRMQLEQKDTRIQELEGLFATRSTGFDADTHLTIEAHELEMQSVQDSAREAIQQLTAKRDKREAKLKEALEQLTDELAEVNRARAELEAKESDLNDTRSEPIQALKKQLQLTLSQKTQLEEVNKKLNQQMDASNSLLEQSEVAITKVCTDKNALEEQVKVLTQQRDDAMAKNQQSATVIEQLKVSVAEAADATKHVTREHEAEMKQLQENAQEAINTLVKKRDVREGKLKDAIKELSEELETAQTRMTESEQRIEELKAQINQTSRDYESISKIQEQLSAQQSANIALSEQVEQLTNQLTEQRRAFQETEAQYQSESEKLAEAFSKKQNSYKTKIKQLQDSLEELFNEHETLKRAIDVERNQHEENSRTLRTQLAEQQAATAQLTVSLDLTRVQLNDDTSRFEAEHKLIEDHCQEELKAQEKLLRSVLLKIGVQLDADANDILSFDKTVEKCGIVLQNYMEDRRQLAVMLQEREDKIRLIEDLEYKLERLQAEKEFMQRQMDENQVAKLKTQIQQMEEERSEMRNDFYIKFNSQSETISGLKDKLSKYEPDQTKPDPDPNVSQNSTGLKGILASLFLTESEMARRV